MKVLFISEMLLLLISTVFALIPRFRYGKKIHICALATAVIFSIITAIGTDYLRSISIGIIIFSALEFLIELFAKKSQFEALFKFISKAIMVLLVIEVFVFNFNSYHLFFGGYEKTDFDLNTATITGFSKSGDVYTSNAEQANVEFTNINKKIGGIYLDVDPVAYKTDYSIDFADETNASYYMRSGLVAGEVFKDIDATKYVVCDFSGEVSKIKINFTSLSDGAVTVKAIGINYSYPSHCSYIRMLLFLLLAIFVRLYFKSRTFASPVKNQLKNAKAVTAIIVLICVLVVFILSNINSGGLASLTSTSGNQISQELVDAFEKGQVHLDKTPSNELLNMKNPYDWSARAEQNVSALWDHVLYNGKYYSYYGIGPVILLFLPYHMITGYYFPSAIAVALFDIIGLIFIAMTFYKLIKKHFGDIPLKIYIVSLIMVLVSSGVWYCTVIANFYEIAQASGFCFVALGAYFLVSSNVISKGKINNLRLLFSSLFFSIAVTCRPTTAVWCVVAVAFIVAGIFKLKKDKSEKKIYAKYLLFALLPFVVIGALQMFYNYARFGSFTDFGIQYSLTINDFTHTQFHTQLAAIGFFDYIFAPPSFSGEFPYITTTLSKLGVNGYYFVATQSGCGLLFRALPVFALFFSPFAIKYLKKENRTQNIILFILVAFVAPFMIIFSIWESGYGVRYMMDFAWQMIACALFVIYIFYRNRGKEAKGIYEKALLVCMILCIIVNVALVYSYFYPSSYVSGYETYFENFARMFSIFNT